MKSLKSIVVWSALIIFLAGSFAGGVFFGRSSHRSLTPDAKIPEASPVSSNASGFTQVNGEELLNQSATAIKQSISTRKVFGAGQSRASQNSGTVRTAAVEGVIPESSESFVVQTGQIPSNILKEELQVPGDDSSSSNEIDSPKDKSSSTVIDHIQRGAIRIGSIDKLPYEIRKVATDQLNQLSKKGYLAVSDEDLMFLDNYHNYLLPI
jgi:hypothetical protein